MKAVVQRRYGPPAEVLSFEEVADPVPAEGEVLVRVRATSVAGDDWHLMRGEPYVARLETGLRKPKRLVPGTDLAGTVEAVGPGVSEPIVGEEVFGWCEGAFAELAAVPASQLVRKPEGLSFEEAATLPVCGFTALQAVRDKGGTHAGKQVLVLGASGGVGTLAVQIAAASGAEVTGVCGVANAELVRSLGARRVIDYAVEDFAADAERYDLIVDLVGNRSLAACRRALRPAGTLVLVGGSGGRWFKGTDRFLKAAILSVFSRQKLTPLIHKDRREDLAALREMVEAGQLRPVLSATYPLAEAIAAIDHFRAGHGRGKVAITP